MLPRRHVRSRYALFGALLGVLAAIGVWDSFSMPPPSPTSWIRGVTNVFWPAFLTGAILLFVAALRSTAKGPSQASSAATFGLLIAGLCLLSVGCAPLIVLFLSPSLDNEGTGMLSTILALTLGLPGLILFIVALSRLSRRA